MGSGEIPSAPGTHSDLSGLMPHMKPIAALISLRAEAAEKRSNVIVFPVGDLGVNDTSLPRYAEPTAY